MQNCREYRAREQHTSTETRMMPGPSEAPPAPAECSRVNVQINISEMRQARTPDFDRMGEATGVAVRARVGVPLGVPIGVGPRSRLSMVCGNAQ